LKSLVDDIKDIGTEQLLLILDNNHDSVFGAFRAYIEKGPICVSLYIDKLISKSWKITLLEKIDYLSFRNPNFLTYF
jgi:hypothetical protein